jgi:hypothetical protein
VAVQVSVFAKNGLKRGAPLMDANFAQELRPSDDPKVNYSPRRFVPLTWTGGGPLGGTEPTFTVHLRTTAGVIRVGAPLHYDADFFVGDGETHEVWLSRR